MNEKLEKLKLLNERWYKGCQLHQQGAFKTPEQRRAAVKRFTDIVTEVFPLWEEIRRHAPELLEGIELLPEPPDDTPVTGRWVGDTWIPSELLAN
jgi:hypothetical protein